MDYELQVSVSNSRKKFHHNLKNVDEMISKNLEEAFSIITNQEFISSIFGIGDKLIEELNNRYTDPDNKNF